MLKKENKVKKFMKKKMINIKGKINKVLRKNIIINIIHILTLLVNIFYLLFLILVYLDQVSDVSFNGTKIFIVFLSILHRAVFLFNNEIKKITFYSDFLLFVADNILFKYRIYTEKPTFFLFYLFPIGYGIYTKFLKK